MENKQNQNHTENGTNTGQNQNTISSMFWENFDNVDTKAELENKQSSKTDITQNTEKMDTIIFSEGQNIQQNNEDIEKTLEIRYTITNVDNDVSKFSFYSMFTSFYQQFENRQPMIKT